MTYEDYRDGEYCRECRTVHGSWKYAHGVPDVCAVCGEQESDSAAWIGTHKYGPVAHGVFVSSRS